MELALKPYHACSLSFTFTQSCRLFATSRAFAPIRVTAMTLQKPVPHSNRKTPKNLRYPRRHKLPPDDLNPEFIRKKNIDLDSSTNEERAISEYNAKEDDYKAGFVREKNIGEEGVTDEDNDNVDSFNDEVEWSEEEVDAIKSMFRGRVPQKPGNINKPRPLPLPIPHKVGPIGLPTTKRHIRRASNSKVKPRGNIVDRVYKNPEFLIDLAKEIRGLPLEEDVSLVLDKWARFLRKGSLSLTIRELGHMGLPDRALQTFCWAQKQPMLYPDDRILGSTVEILGRMRRLSKPFDLEKFIGSASRSVIEALARGVIRGGSINLARRLILSASDSNRTLDASVHAKLILELANDPDKYKLVVALLDELGERDDINLNQQDCSAVMKVCIRVQKFQIVESLFNWYKNTGGDVSVVMYTTLIHSRYTEKKYRAALAVVWEMEGLNCLLDLPAYRVLIKLFVALHDLSRAMKYFLKLKEDGFSPTYDIYRDMIKIYVALRRVSKCKDVCREVEMAGFKLDKKMVLLLQQVENL